MHTKNKQFDHQSQHDDKAQKAQFNDLADDLRRIREKMSETGSAITQCAQDARSQASNVVQQSLQNARNMSSEYQDNILQYVHQNPIKAICCAAVAGMCLVKLFGSRN